MDGVECLHKDKVMTNEEKIKALQDEIAACKAFSEKADRLLKEEAEFLKRLEAIKAKQEAEKERLTRERDSLKDFLRRMNNK